MDTSDLKYEDSLHSWNQTMSLLVTVLMLSPCCNSSGRECHRCRTYEKEHFCPLQHLLQTHRHREEYKYDSLWLCLRCSFCELIINSLICV